MNNILFVIGIIAYGNLLSAQSPSEYYGKADSSFRQKDYRNAALAFSGGIRLEGQNASINRYRSAAASWALANEKDSAFQYLDLIAASDRANKFVARNIEYSADFIAINKDERWQPVINKINERAVMNGYPQEEFIYGRKDGVALTLVWVKPKVKPNGKAIISVQSGGWVSGYNGIEIQTSPMEQYLKKGYTVFAVMHGSAPRYAIPDAVNDMRRSVRYIRYNAGKFNIDPNKIGITGASAGGHLSLIVATLDDKINETAPDPVDRVSSRVQAVAVLFPPTDLLNWGGPGLNLVNAKEILKVRGSWGAADFRVWNDKYRLYEEVTDTTERTKIGKEVSPVYFVTSDDPPVFIIHGDADPTVPLQQSQSIIEKLNNAAVPNRIVVKKGAKHVPNEMNPEWQEFVDWFDKYLK